MIRQLSILLLCAWSVSGATFPAATTSQTDVQAAVTLATASAGNSVTIPAGSSTYASPVIISTHGVHIIGAGTNLVFLSNNQVRVGGQEQPVFQVSSLAADERVEIEGVYFKSLIPVTDCAAVVIYANNPHLSQIVIHDCGFEAFHFAVMAFACDGVIYNSTFYQNFICTRVPGYLTTQLGGIPAPPYPWDTTHVFVIEDCHIVLLNWMIDDSISDSTSPSNYTYRFNTFDIDRGSNIGIDGHDMHNWDNPATELFPLGIQIYGNRWNITGNKNVNPMRLTDVRGGQGSLIYSNTIIGLNVELSFRCNLFVLPLTTNNYAWENYGGNSGTTPATFFTADGVVQGVNFFTSKPALFLQLQYPDPLRNTSRVARVTNFHAKNAHNGP